MARQSAKAPSQRQLRLGENIRHALAEILQRTEIRDEELYDAIVTVAEVRVSPDGKNATAFVLPLGGRNQDVVITALNRHTKFLRGELARKIHVKYTPALKFELDRSFDEGEKINNLLRGTELNAED